MQSRGLLQRGFSKAAARRIRLCHCDDDGDDEERSGVTQARQGKEGVEEREVTERAVTLRTCTRLGRIKMGKHDKDGNDSP